MIVLPGVENGQATGRYDVCSLSGRFEVDLVGTGRCRCVDQESAGQKCIHERRAAIAITEGEAPAPGEAADPVATAEAKREWLTSECNRIDRELGDTGQMSLVKLAEAQDRKSELTTLRQHVDDWQP
jgi:hypothetical protein